MIETAQIFQSVGGQLVRADGYPPRTERFVQAGFDLPALLAQPAWGS